MVFGDQNPTFETVTAVGNDGPHCTGFSTPNPDDEGVGLIERGVDVTGTEFGVRGIAIGGESGPVTGVWGLGIVGVFGQSGSGPPSTPLPGAGVYGLGGPDIVGVIGRASAGTADGVQGFGSGTFSGVAGFGDQRGPGPGVYGQGGGNGAPGVKGIGHGAANTIPEGAVGVYGRGGPGSAGVSGQGSVGVSGQGDGVSGVGVSGAGTVGGSFESDSGGPQLHLVPFSTPLEANTYLLNNGQVGDLYLYSQAREAGPSGTVDYTTILWLCIAPNSGGGSVWAQVQLGDTVGG